MPTISEIDSVIDRLGGVLRADTDRERIDLISRLESLKGAVAAAQARLTIAFDTSQRAEQAAAGVPASERGRGVAAQVALARRDSPHRGGRHLGLARALVTEMPHTLSALSTGAISEWRATLLVRETATLKAEHRAEVDAALAGRLVTLGDRGAAQAARKLAYKLDPTSALRRVRGANSNRRVGILPAPDTMAYVTGFLPVAQGVAVYAALSRHADALKSSGDSRTRGQIMADTFVERITGQAAAGGVPVEVQLVMTDKSLLGGDHTPGHLVGYGPVPAALARSLARADGTDGVAAAAKVWVRRLFTSPSSGELVALESRRREFTGLLRKFLVLRDEVCRTPWCDAPIRHADHVQRAADGGPTTGDNGQGLCQACNLSKEAPGWRSGVSRDGPRSSVVVETPTGHRYASTAPDPPGDLSPRGP